MLIVLPPSETKRDGGVDGTALDLSALSFPELTKTRKAVIAATRSVSRNIDTASKALHLGPTQRFEVLRNRELGRSTLLPAIDRYTGVLYDALDAENLSSAARSFASENVVIHSALFGLLRANDPIPAYRLSHDSRLPTLPLARTWREPITAVLSARKGLVLDLRSEAYVDFGPSEGASSFFLRVVSEGPDGKRRALNHFNKKGKGEFTRELLEAGLDHVDVESLLGWAGDRGIRLELADSGELILTV